MKITIITSTVRPDGTMVEMLYQPEEQNTTFAIYRDNQVEYANELVLNEEESLAPLPSTSDIVKNQVILLPSEATDYGTDAELIQTVRGFIHSYLQVNPLFEQIACYYILLTWVYRRFNELPYLRALGDYGTGKSRFLKVIGSLCYKAIFANGAITTSPIFRIIELCHGTLILNEADFAETDVWSDMTKILNNGFETGFPVLRSEAIGKNFEVKTFDVFGPKVLGARNHFEDKALESRFITEEMDNAALREDIPINLPEKFADEARAIRNQLLMWRFRNYHAIKLNPELINRSIEPRLNQILVPLCSIITDQGLIKDITELIKQMNSQIVKDRGMSREAETLEAILKLQATSATDPTVKDICERFNEGKADREQVTNRKIGYWVREKLGLTLERTESGYTLPFAANNNKLVKLASRYGLTVTTPVDVQDIHNVQDLFAK